VKICIYTQLRKNTRNKKVECVLTNGLVSEYAYFLLTKQYSSRGMLVSVACFVKNIPWRRNDAEKIN